MVVLVVVEAHRVEEAGILCCCSRGRGGDGDRLLLELEIGMRSGGRKGMEGGLRPLLRLALLLLLLRW